MNDSGTFSLAILPVLDADGPTQMGLDLALLDHSHDDPATIWWRSYTWARPTLSLGYFQAWRDAPEAVRDHWKSYDIVRRPSGGGAIVHHGDLTYAIVVPSSHPWSGQARRLYQAVHDGLAQLMCEDGAPVSRRQCVATPGESGVSADHASGGPLKAFEIKPPAPFLCFEDGDADDLILDGVKIVGGAQRRRSWATLQHGSIHWRKPDSGAETRLPGLMDLRTDFRESSSVRWAATAGERLGSLWGIHVRKVPFPAEVMLSAHSWSMRLRDKEWLEKR